MWSGNAPTPRAPAPTEKKVAIAIVRFIRIILRVTLLSARDASARLGLSAARLAP
jgi:hypothetical protein